MIYWDMSFPEDWVDGNGPESGGCNVLEQVQANGWAVCVAKSLGLCVAHVTPTTAVRECADGVLCRRRVRMLACSCCCKLQNCRKNGRERNCGCTTGREEGVRSRGSSNGLQGNETAKRESVLDGTDCCGLEWKLHESTFGNNLVEQSSNEQGLASRDTGISSHVRKDHGIGVARFDEELDSSETVMETGRVLMRTMWCWLLRRWLLKLKDVGLNVGAQKNTHWTSHPEMVDKSIMVFGLAVLWDEVLEFVGSNVCLDGHARHAIAHRTAQARSGDLF